MRSPWHLPLSTSVARREHGQVAACPHAAVAELPCPCRTTPIGRQHCRQRLAPRSGAALCPGHSPSPCRSVVRGPPSGCRQHASVLAAAAHGGATSACPGSSWGEPLRCTCRGGAVRLRTPASGTASRVAAICASEPPRDSQGPHAEFADSNTRSSTGSTIATVSCSATSFLSIGQQHGGATIGCPTAGANHHRGS